MRTANNEECLSVAFISGTGIQKTASEVLENVIPYLKKRWMDCMKDNTGKNRVSNEME